MLWLKVFSQLSVGMIIILSTGLAGLYYITKFDDGGSIKNEISELDKQQNVVKKEIEDLKAELKSLNELDKAMSLMGGEINKFLQFIPNEMTSTMILNHLNQQAKVAGVDLPDIVTHSNTEKKEFYEKLKVSVTVTGLFTQVLIFMSKLTSLSEIITVERFTMETMGGQKASYTAGLNEIKMQMDIYGYRYTSAIIEDNNQEAGK